MVEYRARFDTNKNVQDLMKAKRLLIAGEEELKKAMYWHTENFNCKYRCPNQRVMYTVCSRKSGVRPFAID